MSILKEYFEKWKNLKTFQFIIVTTILNFILMVPIGLILELLNIKDEEIGGINVEDFTVMEFSALVVIIGPIVETLIAQTLPIKITQKILNRKFTGITILISGFLFSGMHLDYSFWYCLITLPLGILLATTYIIFQNRKESSFWVTTSIHSIRNLIAVIAIFGIEGL